MALRFALRSVKEAYHCSIACGVQTNSNEVAMLDRSNLWTCQSSAFTVLPFKQTHTLLASWDQRQTSSTHNLVHARMVGKCSKSSLVLAHLASSTDKITSFTTEPWYAFLYGVLACTIHVASSTDAVPLLFSAMSTTAMVSLERLMSCSCSSSGRSPVTHEG